MTSTSTDNQQIYLNISTLLEYQVGWRVPSSAQKPGGERSPSGQGCSQLYTELRAPGMAKADELVSFNEQSLVTMRHTLATETPSALATLEAAVESFLLTHAVSESAVIAQPANADELVVLLAVVMGAAPTKAAAQQCLALITCLGQQCQLVVGLKHLLFLLTANHRIRPDAALPGMARYPVPSGLCALERFGLRSEVLQALQTILGEEMPGPDAFVFDGTPLFPILPQGVGDQGYSWCTWLQIKEHRDSKINVLSFLSNNGVGVQTYLTAGGALSVRCLPHDFEVASFPDVALDVGRWYFLCIAHTQPSSSFVRSKHASRQPKQNNMSLYVDGLLASALPVPYPVCEPGPLQGTLGGFPGRMGAFHLFAEPLSAAFVLALFSLGSGPAAIPSFHALKSGPVAVFQSSPAGPHLTISITPDADIAATSFSASTPASPVDVHPSQPRLMAKHVLTQLPTSSNAEECLPGGWQQEEQRTTRVQGVRTEIRRNHTQVLARMGGLPLLLACCLPTPRDEAMGPASGSALPKRGPGRLTDAEASALLTLVAEAMRNDASMQRQLFEDAGSISLKRLVLDSVSPGQRTVRLLEGVIAVITAVAAVDLSAERRHTTCFFSMLFDFTYWRHAPDTVQTRLLAFVDTFVRGEHASALSVFRPTAIRRVVDNFRLVNFRSLGDCFSAPPLSKDGAAAAKADLTAAVFQGTANMPSKPLPSLGKEPAIATTSLLDNLAPSLLSSKLPSSSSSSSSSSPSSSSSSSSSPSLSSLSSPSPAADPGAAGLVDGKRGRRALELGPTEAELRHSKMLMSCLLGVASHTQLQHSLSTSDLDALLSLIEQCVEKLPAATEPLALVLLETFLELVETLPTRLFDHLTTHYAHHSFLRLLSCNSPAVSLLALRILGGFVKVLRRNHYASRSVDSKKEVDRKAKDYDRYFIDLSTAVSLQLGSSVLSADAQTALFDMLIGKATTSLVEDGTTRGSTLQRPGSLDFDDTTCFSHATFVGLVLELGVAAPPAAQEQLLVDLLALLRSNTENLEVFGSLFWQRALLPYFSGLVVPNHPLPTSLALDTAADTTPGPTTVVEPAVRDAIIMRIFTTMLGYCLMTEQKGWIALDEALWCLQREAGSALNDANLWNIQMELVARTLMDADACLDNPFASQHYFDILKSNGSTRSIASSSPPTSPTGKGANAYSLPATPLSPRRMSSAGSSVDAVLPRNLLATFEMAEYLLFSYNLSWLSPKGATRDGVVPKDPPPAPAICNDAEQELLSRLLIAFTCAYPLPERRQDALRLTFRYLEVVLPHSACAALVPNICDCIRHLLCQRLQQRSMKNHRIVLLALSLVKDAQAVMIRRHDTIHAARLRDLIHDLYVHWGPAIFYDDSNPNPPSVPVRAPGASSILHVSEERTRVYEEAMFLLYQTDLPKQTGDVFVQHVDRFELLLNVRLNKMHTIINDYTARRKMLDAGREQQFFSASAKHAASTTQRQQRDAMQIKAAFIKEEGQRATAKQHKQLVQFQAAVTSMQHQLMHSCLDVPPESPHTHSDGRDHWKVDPVESPSRMRRLLKKDFKGTTHPEAVSNLKQRQEAEAKQLSGAQIDRKKLGELAKAKRKSISRVVVPDEEKGEQYAGAAAENKRPDEGWEAAGGAEKSKKKGREGKGAQGLDAVVLKNLDGSEEEDVGEGSDDEEDEGTEEEENEEEDGEDSEGEEEMMTTKRRPRGGQAATVLQVTLVMPLAKYIGTLTLQGGRLSFQGMLDDGEQLEGGFMDKEELSEAGPSAGRRKKRRAKGGGQEEKHLRWSLKQVRQVLPCAYLLRESAVEVFLTDFRNYFFHCHAGELERNRLYKELCHAVHLPIELSPARRLSYSGLTVKWQRWEISTFDYLMHLNTIAGRTYNDLTQYPVFPWVLADYESDVLDLGDPNSFRDLSKPVGALDEDRWCIFEERFRTFEDETIPPFHYGSHYSSAGIALHYLCRLEPFATLAISMQGGRWDLPDRLFHSIALAWKLSVKNINDVKELVPEFFYSPNFLRNLNGYDLGTKQEGQVKVDDVLLPPWANGSPEEFIRLHREALESDHVSANLHHWIDLIFGFQQRGKAAEEACNVFFYLTYRGSVDLDSIKDASLRKATEDQIANFGQTPAQLLTSPHPKRMLRAEAPGQKVGRLLLPHTADGHYSAQLVRKYAAEQQAPFRVCLARTGVAIAISYGVAEGGLELQSHALATFLLHPEKRWTAEGARKVAPRGGTKRRNSLDNRSSLSAGSPVAAAEAGDVGGTTVTHKYSEGAATGPDAVPFLSSETVSPRILTSTTVGVCRAAWLKGPAVVEIARSGKFLFTGGYMDCSIKCHLLTHQSKESTRSNPAASLAVTCKPISSVSHLYGMVTALALSQSQVSLFSGHAEGTVCMWRVYMSSQDRNRPPLGGTPYATFTAHSGPVISLAVSTGRGIAASLAQDLFADEAGSLAIYCTRKGRFVRSVCFSLEALLAAMPSDLAAAVHTPAPGSTLTVVAPPVVDMKSLAICPDGNIVVYGVVQGRLPVLALYSISGTLLTVRSTGTFLNSISATPYQVRSPDKEQGFLVTAGQDCTVTFRTTFDLSPVQTFYCDGRWQETNAHLGGVDSLSSAFPPLNLAKEGPVGIAAVDVTPNAQHMLVTVHRVEGSLDQDERESRMLLFALPHSENTGDGALGFSVDASAHAGLQKGAAIGAVGKAVLGKIDNVGTKGLEIASSSVKGAKTRITGMFGSIFGKKGDKSGT